MCVLKVDLVLVSIVELHELSHRLHASLVWVACKSLVPLLEEEGHKDSQQQVDVGYEGVDQHGLNYLTTHVSIPHRVVVIVLAIKVLSQNLWRVLGHVGVHQQQDQTRVEELSDEDVIGGLLVELTDGVVLDHLNPCDYQLLEQKVHSHYDPRDGVAQNVCLRNITFVLLADLVGFPKSFH